MEYSALIYALENCKEGDEIYTDSQLIVGQVMKGWKVKARHLLPFVLKAKELIKEKNVKITWIPRNQNYAGNLLER